MALDFFFLPAASVEPVDYIKLVSGPRMFVYSSSQVRGREREREKRFYVSFNTPRRVTGPGDGAASGCGVVFFVSPFLGGLIIISWQLP